MARSQNNADILLLSNDNQGSWKVSHSMRFGQSLYGQPRTNMLECSRTGKSFWINHPHDVWKKKVDLNCSRLISLARIRWKRLHYLLSLCELYGGDDQIRGAAKGATEVRALPLVFCGYGLALGGCQGGFTHVG